MARVVLLVATAVVLVVVLVVLVLVVVLLLARLAVVVRVLVGRLWQDMAILCNPFSGADLDVAPGMSVVAATTFHNVSDFIPAV